MSRRKRLNAVATTALVAAFPVFPLFADEPTPPDDVAAQAVATDAASFAIPDLNAAFADFNVSLFDVPEGESVEFYRKRAAELQVAWRRAAFSYRKKLEEAARANGASEEFTASAFTMFPGTIPTPTGFVKAPADSVPARCAAALADVLRRLADSPELPPEIRGGYYSDWTLVAPSPLGERPLVELRDFYAKLLADEKAKSAPDLARVRYLSERVANVEFRVNTGRGIFDNLESPQRFDRAAVEELLDEDLPLGVNFEFYDALDRKLFAAQIDAQEAGEDDAFIARIRQKSRAVTPLRTAAARQEVAALDVDAVKKLVDVPEGESGAFYLARFEETQKVKEKLRAYNAAGVGDLSDLAQTLRNETIPALSRRVANADDLPPLERFEYFTRWIDSCDVAEKREALAAEIARDATSAIDQARKAYVELSLLHSRLLAAVHEARKDLPETERHRSATKIQTPLAPELEAKFAEIFDEIAERADDGALPWKLDETWAFQAGYFANIVESYVGAEYATQLRKKICAVLADSENETNRRFLGMFASDVRNEN